MRSPAQIARSNLIYGRIFIFLGLLSFFLCGFHWYFGNWKIGAMALPGAVFFTVVGRLVISGINRWPGKFGDGPPPSDAGKPVPVEPNPPHHLQAALDLPPSKNTHSWPKD